MKENIIYSNKTIEKLLNILLKRCARFVSNLVFDQDRDIKILSMVFKKCSNLEEIDLDTLVFCYKEHIEIIKPIFEKIKKFKWIIHLNDIDDEDLKSLFSLNKKLESLEINPNDSVNGAFLDTLPKETVKELIFEFASPIAFNKICHVRIIITFFIS